MRFCYNEEKEVTVESIIEHAGKELNWVGVRKTDFVLLDVQTSIAELLFGHSRS